MRRFHSALENESCLSVESEAPAVQSSWQAHDRTWINALTQLRITRRSSSSVECAVRLSLAENVFADPDVLVKSPRKMDNFNIVSSICRIKIREQHVPQRYSHAATSRTALSRDSGVVFWQNENFKSFQPRSAGIKPEFHKPYTIWPPKLSALTRHYCTMILKMFTYIIVLIFVFGLNCSTYQLQCKSCPLHVIVCSDVSSEIML